MGAAVVVGGGVAGILSALLLRKSHERVLLVEREARLGGLLRSFRAPEGAAYDLGTHFPSDTGHPEIDELLLGPIRRDTDAWRRHTVLRVGNWFGGRLNDQSPCIDARDLPPAVYERGLAQLLAAPPTGGPRSALRPQLEAFYGPTLTAAVFEPLMEKFYGRGADALAPDAHLLFVLPRLIALDPQKARELKRDPRLDAKLAFHSYREPPSSLELFYPKAGGVGRWIDLLTVELARRGVEVLCGESVARIQAGGDAVTLASGRAVECAALVWTTPLFECLKACGAEAPAAPPALRQTTLYHLEFDRPFLPDLHFLTCFDPALRSFRATLYPNMRGEGSQDAPYNCTVETLSSPGEDGPSVDAVAAELRTMTVVAPDARLLHSHVERVKGGFPVLTPEFLAGTRRQLEAARAALPRALFAGKARGSAFFMPDVLKEAHAELAARAGAGR